MSATCESTLVDQLKDYILQDCSFELERILEQSHENYQYGLPISVLSLFERVQSSFSHLLLADPLSHLPFIHLAIQKAQLHLLSTTTAGRTKSLIHPRLVGMPLAPGVYHDRIPGVEMLNRLVMVRGSVIRTGAVKMVDRSKTFVCGKCGGRVVVKADERQGGQIVKPLVCMIVREDGEKCGSGKFEVAEEEMQQQHHSSTKDDYQEIKIQELTNLLDIGAVPRSITVILKHELVDKAKAGDEVLVTGVILARWHKSPRCNQRCDTDFVLVANNISIMNNRFDQEKLIDVNEFATQHWINYRESRIKGRDLIVGSFCAGIYGLHLIKLAIILTVIGGSTINAEDYSKEEVRRHRREGHLLLVGDPGTAKSQFLVSAARLSHRSVITTGSGSTNAGLTVAAVKESGNEWQLEAGALVLADGGLCCIDEFNALRPHDRAAIHEAMEQQTLSVAKAGLVCKLNTRCSVIAACNAKGKFDNNQPISSNVALASPLLSRFDLIFVMSDRKDEEWDKELASAILTTAAATSTTTHSVNRRASFNKSTTMAASMGQLDYDTLRAYLMHVRHECNPTLSPEARLILGKYYQLQRRSDIRDAARTTIRLLESLIRLAQAHAKLTCHGTVQIMDAIWAIILMETSLCTQGMLPHKPDIYAVAPVDPEVIYREYEDAILRKLEINPKVINNTKLQLDAEADRILCSWPDSQPN